MKYGNTHSPNDHDGGLSDTQKAELRNLPSVDEIMGDPNLSSLEQSFPHDLILYSIRKALDEQRRSILRDTKSNDGEAAIKRSDMKGRSVVSSSSETSCDTLADALKEHLIVSSLKIMGRMASPSLKRVVNATGIVIHTNLGRSILPGCAVEAVKNVSSHYSALEYDVENRTRGSRHSHLEELVCYLTGAESAIAVNNNAAAVFLVLSEFAKGKKALVSRGELVEIGGSFRIPDIMALSDARMIEVGTTNKTRPSDYFDVIDDDVALVLKVHPSNYRIEGFTESVSAKDLRQKADDVNRRRREYVDTCTEPLLIYQDQGSGSLIDLRRFGFDHEPTVQEALKEGCDLVSFSGDKLLGGAQAGFIIGRKKLIDRLKKNPLVRALRLDKMTLSAMEATLRLYLDPEQAIREIPTLHMLTADAGSILEKAHRLRTSLEEAVDPDYASFEVINVIGKSGGGALPECEFDSYAVAVSFNRGNVQSCEDYLISGRDVPVIGRINKDRLLLDARTMLEEDHEETVMALREYFKRL